MQNLPISAIQPYENNPRNNALTVAAVAKSIRDFGFLQPIVVDKEKVIVVGHTRYQAALDLGLTEVPVIVADNLTEAQAKAYRIADNKVAEHSTWDFDLLTLELKLLEAEVGSIEMTDFTWDEVNALTSLDNGDVKPTSKTPEEAGTREFAEGQTWDLGGNLLTIYNEGSAEALNKAFDAFDKVSKVKACLVVNTTENTDNDNT